ncbi:MAG: serine/threonine protein kinase [Planctomycetia bacterium]|nr:serine/threonine protein kinase [Planctomycetia bacterium]
MAAATVGELQDSIRALQLLNAAQLNELAQLQRRHADVRALGREVAQRGLLTVYQVNLLLQGRGPELVVGPYLILEKLGEGGTGQVYKARQRSSGRITALKVLRKDAESDPDTVRRFTRELEVARQVEHPNLIRTYEAGPIGGTLVLAMEYVPGVNLDQLVREAGPLPVNLACEYIRQAACGLAHAHERGLVHRDIKPGNLMVVDRASESSGQRAAQTTLKAPLATQQLKILDLGLARLLEPPRNSATKGLTMLTGDSVMMGTPDYMSPEQALDLHGADIRSDIYSLGCTAFFLLTGQPPYPAGSLALKLMKHQQAEIPSLRQLRPEVPAAIEAVVQKMLAKKPADRYQTPGEVAQALAAAPAPGKRLPMTMLRLPTGKRRRLLLALVPLVLFFFVALVLWLWPRDSAAPTGAQFALVVPTAPRATAVSPPSTTEKLPKVVPSTQATRSTSRFTITQSMIVHGRVLVRDAVIDSGLPMQRFGNVPQNNQIKRTSEATVFLVAFDVARISAPPGLRLDKAILGFYVWDPHDKARTKVEIHAVKTPWDEATVTWSQGGDGKPWQNGKHFAVGLDTSTLLGQIIVQPDTTKDIAEPPVAYGLEITEQVRRWMEGKEPNHGLALVPVADRAIDDGLQSRFQIYASEYNRMTATPRLSLMFKTGQ